MSGTLPRWLEHLLDVPSAGSGEGTLWTLRYAWPLPPWMTVLAVALAVGFIVSCYLREAGTAGRGYRLALSAIRVSLVAILFFMLAQAVLTLERTGLPYAVVIVDDSGSMSIEDRYSDDAARKAAERHLASAKLDKPSRLNLAKSVLLAGHASVLSELENRYKLKLYVLDDQVRNQPNDLASLVPHLESLQPTGEATRLGQGVRAVLNELRGTPPSAIILLSDGITTEGESLSDAAVYARRKGVPLFTVAVGSETPVRDLEIGDLLVDDVVFADDVVNFEFKLTSTGYAGRPLEVVLRERGKSAPLARMTVAAGTDGKPQKLRLAYRPTQVGEFEYVVEVQHLADELHADNNRQQRLVTVRKEQIRVLLVQSYPNYEFRYLKQMLARDSTIELKTVLQEADLQYAEIDKTALAIFPERREDLFEYDAIIFGDVDPSFLSASAMQNLAAFVTQKGGGLVVVAGPLFTPLGYRDTPLAALVPIDFNSAAYPAPGEPLSAGFQVLPTELGASMPPFELGDTPQETAAIWRKLPPLYWLFETGGLKPAARTLAEGTTRDGRRLPAMVMQYVGAGKVLFHATDETWRWRYRVGDVFFARYWVQTLRYLSRSKLRGKDRSAELVADRREYRRGESVHLRVRFLDDRRAPADDNGVTVIVEQEGHQNRRVQLERNSANRGVFEGLFSKPSVGKYHAWIATPALEDSSSAADFSVVAPPGEFERVQMETAELKRAADITKGRFYTLASVDGLLSDLPAGEQVPVETLPPVVLWNKWPLLCLFLALIIGEWLLRKRKGML